ncbi:tetratricopeptide repeat protein [Flavobacteriaceae bacterium LMO-SS05]
MKQTIFLITFFLSANFLFAQTNFNSGFKAGYGNGYCQDQGVGCIKPTAPIAPIPTVSENSSSYQDGYNRGFQMGINAQKPTSNSTNRQRYKTAKPTFVEDKMYNPYGNLDNAIALANALRESKGRAMQHMKNEEYQEAADICFAGLRVAPKDDEFMMILGQAYRMTGDKENAILWLKKSSKLRPSDKNLKSMVAKLESGELEVKSQNENKNENKNVDIENILSLMGSGKYQKAIEQIDEGIGNEQISMLYGIRGTANYLLKNYSEAISDITKSAKTTNEILPDFLFYRALAKSEVGDYFGAISDYDIIIPKGADGQSYDMATIYNNKAYSYVNLKNYEEALPLVTKALELDKSKWYIWDTRAEIYFNTNEYKKAISDANSAIKIQEDSNTFYIRGLAHLKLKEKDLGCKDLSRAGELGKKEAYDEIKKYCN